MPKPKKISASHSQGVLSIEWDDGHFSVYPFAGLRAACPCAECRGGHANMGQPGSADLLEIPLQPVQSAELEKLEKVGNYALQITWKDGHSFGIYSWDYLRELCPCDVCSGKGV